MHPSSTGAPVINRNTLIELARQAAHLVLTPTLTTLAITAAGCWFAGWRTLDQFAVALLIAGGLIFGAGAFGMLGGRALDGNYRYLTACSVSSEDVESRMLRRLSDNGESFAFLLRSALVAGLLFAVALAIRALV